MKSDTKSILLGGLTLPALLGLTQIAIIYSWWTALLIAFIPFIAVSLVVIIWSEEAVK